MRAISNPRVWTGSAITCHNGSPARNTIPSAIDASGTTGLASGWWTLHGPWYAGMNAISTSHTILEIPILIPPWCAAIEWWWRACATDTTSELAVGIRDEANNDLAAASRYVARGSHTGVSERTGSGHIFTADQPGASGVANTAVNQGPLVLAAVVNEWRAAWLTIDGDTAGDAYLNDLAVRFIPSPDPIPEAWWHE